MDTANVSLQPYFSSRSYCVGYTAPPTMAVNLILDAFAADSEPESDVPTQCAVASVGTAVEQPAPEQTMSQQSADARGAVVPVTVVTPMKKEETECYDKMWRTCYCSDAAEKEETE